ncbi:MAG: MFS transporter [Phycisphaerae bacterium]
MAHQPESLQSRSADLPPGFRLRRGRNWFFLGLTYASYYLGRYNLSPVAPELKAELNLTNADYGWIQSGRDGAYAVGQMINGLFTDRIGGRQAMSIGAVATIILNLAFGLASRGHPGVATLGLLIAIRSFDGYMQAFGAPGMIKINTAWFRRRERGGFAGIFGFMINLGAAGAGKLAELVSTGFTIPLLFTAMIVPANWRYVFFIPPIVIAVVVLLMNLLVRNTPEEAGYTIAHDDDPPGDPNERVRLSAVLAKIASQPTVWIVAVAYFCTGFVRRAIESWWSLYLDGTWHAGKTSTLYSLLAYGLPFTASLGSLISGYISDLFFRSRRAPVAAILYLAQTALCLVALGMRHGGTPQSGALAVTVVILIAMMCNSTHSILGTAAAMDLGGRKMAGCSSGIIDSFQYYGALISGGVLGLIFDWVGRGQTALAATSAPTTATAAANKLTQVDPRVWFGSMLPFGLLGASLMIYLWIKHRGSDTRGA